MKVILDNNVGDNYDRLISEDRAIFAGAFTSGRYEHCLTHELLYEITRMADSEARRSRLQSRVGWLLSLGGRIFRDGDSIIEDEIGGVHNIFEPKEDEARMKGILSRIASGEGTPRPYRDVGKKNMFDDVFDAKKAIQNHFRGEMGKGEAKKDYPDYVSFRHGIAEELTETMVRAYFRIRSLDEARVEHVLSRRLEYPFFFTHTEIYWACQYLYLIEDMRVDKGDVIDASFILYMLAADIMISNDQRNLRRIFDLVCGEDRIILTLDEFMTRIRSESTEP